MIVLQTVGLLLAGLLAGEEFVVRYGVQPALAALPDLPHLQARQALIGRLRILVPAIMVPTVLVGIAIVVFSGSGAGFGFRIAGIAALIAFVLFSFFGTVPINIRVDDWDAASPPADWRSVIYRWQTIDVFRSGAAIVAFAMFLVAFAAQVG